jgi:CO dehydrogenase/acetyl-CoA synthase beta subunit
MMLIATFFVACGDEDVIDTTLPRVVNEVGEANSLSGAMHYDQDHQLWYVSVEDTSGSTESYQRLDVWGRIDPVFQKEGLPVVFSGDVLQWIEEAKEEPLNTGHLIIAISQIQERK